MMESSTDNKKEFQKWLEKRFSTKIAAKITLSLSMLELLLHKNGVAKKRFYKIESTSEIGLLVEDLKKNKGLRLHSKNRKITINNLSLYKEYLASKNEEVNIRPNEGSEKQKHNVEKMNVSPKSYKGFYSWLTEVEGVDAPTGRSYVSAINNCDTFCRDHNIGTGKIYSTASLEETSTNISLLISDSEFCLYNDAQHHRLTTALARYKKYMGIVDVVICQSKCGKISESQRIDTGEQMRIRATLELPRFEYGFKNDDVELYRFRASYVKVNGIECALEDVQLLNAIHEMGFEFEGKIYIISSDKKEIIAKEIKEYKNQGINVIYYEQLYDLNSNEYFDAKIVSAGMLKEVLKDVLSEFKYKNNYFILELGQLTEIQLIQKDILRVWGHSTLQTIDELSIKLPLIPVDKLKLTLSQQNIFVWNSTGTYTRADLFEADAQEIEQLIGYIEEQCEEAGRASLDDVPFDDLKALNSELSETAIFTCFYRLIEDRFDRNSRVLTKKGNSQDTYTAIFEFCQKQDKCTYDQLVQIAEKVAGTIRQPEIIEAASAVMVRLDKDKFIADRFIRFDVDGIDAALDHIMTENFMGMKEIVTFSIFPFCGYRWNLFLLESYCRRFSKKYRYETRRANLSNSGAVVSEECSLNYHDIMVQAVARSGRNLNQEEVFDFLTETGYMDRKRYYAIDLLIKEAAELRERRK